jgi:hypothetical protein
MCADYRSCNCSAISQKHAYLLSKFPLARADRSPGDGLESLLAPSGVTPWAQSVRIPLPAEHPVADAPSGRGRSRSAWLDIGVGEVVADKEQRFIQ